MNMAEMSMERSLLPNMEHSVTLPPAYSEEVVIDMHRNYPLNSVKNCQQNSNQPTPEFVVSELGNVGTSQPPAHVNSPNIKVVMPGPGVLPVGPDRMRMRCYHCGADVQTSITKSNKAIAHLSCLMLCMATCILCCWVPYCMDSCKKVDHKCPCCGEYLGTYDH